MSRETDFYVAAYERYDHRTVSFSSTFNSSSLLDAHSLLEDDMKPSVLHWAAAARTRQGFDCRLFDTPCL